MTATVRTTESQRLMAAILADPSDMVARLAWADAIEEEGGDLERAALVRACIRGSDWHADALLQANGAKWFPGLYATRDTEAYRHGPEVRWLGARPTDSPTVTGLVRAGFVERVCCLTEGRWEKIGPEMVSAHPLTRVDLRSREPLYLATDKRGWAVRGEGEGDLPGFLSRGTWHRLQGCEQRRQMHGRRYWFKISDSREDALDNLSRTLLRAAKDEAKRRAGK